MARQSIPLSEQLRQAIATSGQTCYRISKATGISEATLSRFMSGVRGLPMPTLDRLGLYLDLRVTVGPRR
jgi:hypothetical protein